MTTEDNNSNADVPNNNDNTWTLEWPEYSEGEKRKPKTTSSNAAVLKAVLEAAKVESSRVDDVDKILQLLWSLVHDKTHWRQNYDKIYYEIVQLQTQVTADTCTAMCQAGINAAERIFLYRNQQNNTTMAISEAFHNNTSQRQSSLLQTLTYTNTNNDTTTTTTTTTNDSSRIDNNKDWKFPLASPVDNGKTLLYGQDAINQVNKWYEYGCLESSAALHANTTFHNNNNSNNNDDTIFCVLGVTSELAPTKSLLQYVPNAHVIGVSRNINVLVQWYQNLISSSSSSAAPNTTLQVTSADMLQHGPMIAQWIIETIKVSNKKKVVLLPMGYMDGEANVRLVISMDSIMTYVIDQLILLDETYTISVVQWTSPSTVYVLPPDAAQDSYNRYQQEIMVSTTGPSSSDSATTTTTGTSSISNILQILPRRILSLISFGTLLQPNSVVKTMKERQQQENQSDNDETSSPSNSTTNQFIICNAASNLQGPNYLLAKMLQQWRCIVLSSSSKYKKNVHVYAPHTPATRTLSVTHSTKAAAAIEGLPYIAPPMITFDVEPCSTLMTAILLNQLQQQQNQSPQLQHPLELFWDGSVHGGIWRCPFDINTIGIPAYIIGQFLLSTNQAGSCPQAALAIPSSSTSFTNATTTTTNDNKVTDGTDHIV